ncbi:AAA family ATPase [Streptomyces sp. NPDC047000]|uniref:AAA family ATPase n=1 Tax=Streptomyces sp. NPDC047000 TaxID=3155474 RepID=UPI0033CE2A2E
MTFPDRTDPTAEFRDTLATLIHARFPLLHVRTHEEDRLMQQLNLCLRADPRLVRHPRPVIIWKVTTGLRDTTGRHVVADTTEPLRALEAVQQFQGSGVFVFLDLHHFLLGTQSTGVNPLTRAKVVRTLRDLREPLKRGRDRKTLIIVSPELALPPDLDKDIHLIELNPPSKAELDDVLTKFLRDNGIADRSSNGVLVTTAHGLTCDEAENAFARAFSRHGRIDKRATDLVADEKRQAVRRTEILEYVSTLSEEDLEIGGLGTLRNWLKQREGSWLGRGSEWGIRQPRGILITGVPGCGKSLTAKCTSVAWNLPLLRLDVGRIFAGLVGSSEANMREALSLAEAMSPSILWIDELEKGFARSAGGLDSGVGSRVFGTFLTWMQEHTAFVFVIATANDISQLPAEFLRKGRFDEIFFVDLPTRVERSRILRIHIGRYLKHPAAAGQFPHSDEAFNRLAEMSPDFSGAELLDAVNSAAFAAFQAKRPIRFEDVAAAVEATAPLARIQTERVREMQQWAHASGVLLATEGKDLEKPLTVTGDGALLGMRQLG